MKVYISIDGEWYTERGATLRSHGTYQIECSEQEAKAIVQADLMELFEDAIMNGRFDQDPWIHARAPSPFCDNVVIEASLDKPKKPGKMMLENYYTMAYALRDVGLLNADVVGML